MDVEKEGRAMSRSVTLHWSDVRAGRLQGDLAARARTLLRDGIGPRVCVSGLAVEAQLSENVHVSSLVKVVERT